MGRRDDVGRCSTRYPRVCRAACLVPRRPGGPLPAVRDPALEPAWRAVLAPCRPCGRGWLVRSWRPPRAASPTGRRDLGAEAHHEVRPVHPAQDGKEVGEELVGDGPAGQRLGEFGHRWHGVGEWPADDQGQGRRHPGREHDDGDQGGESACEVAGPCGTSVPGFGQQPSSCATPWQTWALASTVPP